MPLYDEIGGAAAIDAALDTFYPKVLGDPVINRFFQGVDMARLKRHAHAFLTMAFGGPNQYQGPGARLGTVLSCGAVRTIFDDRERPEPFLFLQLLTSDTRGAR